MIIKIPEWMLYIIIILLLGYTVDMILTFYQKYLEWKIRKQKNALVDQSTLKKLIKNQK